VTEGNPLGLRPPSKSLDYVNPNPRAGNKKPRQKAGLLFLRAREEEIFLRTLFYVRARY
jgi:hypothetical protein